MTDVGGGVQRGEGLATARRLIRAAFLEDPGLVATAAQISRLTGIDENAFTSVAAALVGEQFLKQTAHGAFVLNDERPIDS